MIWVYFLSLESLMGGVVYPLLEHIRRPKVSGYLTFYNIKIDQLGSGSVSLIPEL